ncbi:MAG: YdcF family protein [Verrucomicrobiota bacterium]
MKPHRPFWGLVRRRECLLPTWRGWLLLLLTGLLMATGAVRKVQSFLAVTDPVAGGALVVEGWAPDYALEEVITEFRHHHYTKLYVVGVPLEKGAPLSEYKTYAELGAATLLKLGLDRDSVQAVPTPAVRQDRTYTSALALKQWLQEHDAMPAELNLMSLGAHARRSRLLFEKAFGRDTRVGIIALEDRDYDPELWWKSSQGVRTVTDELIAYGYARLWFHPGKQ